MRLDDASVSWDLLTEHVEAFLERWEADGQPPAIADFLPSEEGLLRQFVLVELVKVDLDYRYQTDAARKRLEEYLVEFPDLRQGDETPTDLIFEEFQVRRAAGEEVDPREYYRRFPNQAEVLSRLLQIDSPTVSLSLVGTRRPPEAQSGEVIDGDFQLLVELGKGAFGSVFLARQQSMQRLVALKLSNNEGSEPQTLAQFDHPHIVRVFDQRLMDDEKTRMLYMQYVPGGSLQDAIEILRETPHHQRDGRILANAVGSELKRAGGFVSTDLEHTRRLEQTPWAEVVCRLGVELATALDYAHQKGVLHRDVKPANVLLTADGSAKLADFNISFSSQLDGVSPAAYFGGSLAYMSPEQLEACNPSHARLAEELDSRSDLYSLAVLLWELLEGQRPWGDEQIAGGWSTALGAMADRRRAGAVDPPAESADPVTRQLRRILLKCLSPNPEDRYASGAQLARELQLCLQPHALELLCEPARGWRRWTLKWPLFSAMLATLLPNAMAGVFNWAYNRQAIIEKLAGALNTFNLVQLTINSIAFPVGVVIAITILWPILRQLRNREGPSPFSVRRRALRFGKFIALLGIVEWTIAGVAYPVSMHVLVGGVEAPEYVHFVASLVLCGLIAAAYPFFLLSLLSVRVFYPALACESDPDERDAGELESLGRQMAFFLYVAGGVPSLGMLALLTTSLITNQQNTFALLILSVLGFLGFGVVLLVYRQLQRDLTALVGAATTTGETPLDHSRG